MEVVLISIRGNRRILSIERELGNFLCEKLTRTQLLEEAIKYAYPHRESLDWLSLSDRMSQLPDDNITVPSFMQARLDEDHAKKFNEIQDQIYKAIKQQKPDARYVQDKYVWQLCLMALLEHDKEQASLNEEDDRTDYDKLESAKLFLDLMSSTDKSDEYLASRMINELKDWAKTRTLH